MLNSSLVLPDETDNEERSAFVKWLVVIQLAVSILALLLNILVFLIGCLRIRGSYRHYLSNLAFIDLMFALGAVIFLGQNFWPLPDFAHAISHLLVSVTVPLMTVALMPISIDRYVKICKRSRFAHCFRIIPLVCIAVDLFPITTFFLCKPYIPYRWANWIYVVAIPVASLMVVFACNMALFRYISRHVKVVANLENRRRLDETKQLARATCIQAITPLCIHLPALVGVYGMNATDQIRDEPAEYMRELAHLIFLLMVCNPLMDALVTIWVVRTYRVCCRNLIAFLLPTKIFEYRMKSIRTLSNRQFFSPLSPKEIGGHNITLMDMTTERTMKTPPVSQESANGDVFL